MFSGAGWRVVFHLGVFKFIQENVPAPVLDTWRVSGVSAGAGVGLAMCLGLPAQRFIELMRGMIR